MSYHRGMGAPIVESTAGGTLVVGIPSKLRRRMALALSGVSGGPRGNRVSIHAMGMGAMGDANLITGTILDPNTWNNVPAPDKGLSTIQLAAFAVGGLVLAKALLGKKRRR